MLGLYWWQVVVVVSGRDHDELDEHVGCLEVLSLCRKSSADKASNE